MLHKHGRMMRMRRLYPYQNVMTAMREVRQNFLLCSIFGLEKMQTEVSKAARCKSWIHMGARL